MIVDWSRAGPCRQGDPDDWFIDNQTNQWAWELCRGCPILRPCGEYALLLDVQGVWGGMTVRRRRAIQRRALTTGALRISSPRMRPAEGLPG